MTDDCSSLLMKFSSRYVSSARSMLNSLGRRSVPRSLSFGGYHNNFYTHGMVQVTSQTKFGGEMK